MVELDRDPDRDRPSSSSSSAFRPRHTVHISSIRPSASAFPAQRNPLLPPPPRKRELPFSSQDRYSSPEKVGAPPHAGVADMAGQAGPSRPRLLSPSPPPPPVNMSDDEDEFDGIEDALPTQADPHEDTLPKAKNAVGLASLNDLFADDENESIPTTSGISSGTKHAGPSKRVAPSSGRQNITDLSSSPPLFPPFASSSRRPTHSHSDTPPSPLPKTPRVENEDIEIEWSPSPVTQRTRKQRAPIESPPPPLLARQPQSSKARSKGKATLLVDDTAMDVDEGYDDMPFPNDFDFDSLEEPSGSGSSAPLQRNADAGRAFRPSTMSTSTLTSKEPKHSSPSSRESRVVSALDEINDPHRLLLIPDLSPAEQDFYRNHWRRGADKGSTKRSTAGEAEEFSDGEFAGPQPPAEKKTSYKRGGGAGFRRGGFRGRGRGRGRARGGKR